MIPNFICITDAPYGAKCDNSTDDWNVIQSAINDIRPGGTLFVPGISRVSNTLVVNKSISILGHGLALSGFVAQSDINVLRFEMGPNMDTCHVEKISVIGSQDPQVCEHNTMAVETNMCVHMRDLRVWGGYSALIDRGVDGERHNCFFSGARPDGGAVTSNGANWWVRCKLDGAFGHQAWGFLQGNGLGGVMENHLDQCDFSGDYDNSVLIDDGGTGSAVTVFNGGVFANPITIQNAKWTAFTNAEFGHNINSGSSPITVANSFGFGAITVTGTQRALSNNFGIT